MKTIRKAMLTLAIVATSTFVMANDKPKVKVENVGAKTVAVVAFGLGNANTGIQLRNKQGKALYKESVKSGEHFAKRLELAAIANGEYILEIESADSFTAIPVVLTSDSALVKTADQVTIVKPKLAMNGDKLDVIIADEFTDEIWVSIFDVDSNRLAFERISSENLKRFDLSRLKKGSYTIQMTTRGKRFIQSVSLDK
ncbi:MAG: hypothetical protein VYB44_03760 [Bacteroidota bacterium]|nr:hypothetical protein [Bacteroidota bacterium]